MRQSGPQEMFVYGTLLPGQENFEHIASRVSGWRSARTRGRLFHLFAGYPAMVQSEGGWVRGELLSFKGSLEEALEICDLVEGFRPEEAGSSLFERVVRLVEPTDDEPREAWCYCLAPEHHVVLSRFGREIASGDWLDYLQRQERGGRGR